MSAVLAEGLLAVLDRVLLRMNPNLDRAFDWLRDAATPPADLEFKASDGALYTGLVVLERSRVILMLAVRGPVSQPTPPRYEPPRYVPQPVRPREMFDDDPGDGWPPDPYRPV